jgi:hypothetical protein
MRGRKANVGDTRTSLNGYDYTRTEKGWQLTHRLIAEDKLGRELEPDERIKFIDNDRTNLDPNNIMVYKTKVKKEEPEWLNSTNV